jgi:hypothetical protein
MTTGADEFDVGRDDGSIGEDEFATWDAAYVLGALTPADRRRYEEHLDRCPACRAMVAELAGLPGMLALVPRQTALALLDDAPPSPRPALPVIRDIPDPPDALMHSLVDRTRRDRRRRRWIAAGAAVAAAAAAIAIAVPLVLSGTSEDTSTATAQPEVVASRTMDPLVSTPLSADFDLIAQTSGGTLINMECRYADGGISYTGGYSMWVTTTSGMQTHLASWEAKPGDVINASAAIDVPPAEIQQVDIRSTATQEVLLSSAV